MSESRGDHVVDSRFSDRLRHGLKEYAREVVQQIPWFFAWSAVLAVGSAAVFVGALVVLSVLSGPGGGDGGDGTAVGTVVAGLVTAVFATGGVSYLVRLFHRREVITRPPHQGARFVASFAVFGVVSTVCAAVQIVVPDDSSSEAIVRSGWGIVWTLAAGFIEEPVFAALPTLIASWCLYRFRWCQRKQVVLVPLIALSAVSRGAMHLYQGWDSALLAVVWGAVAASAYAVLGSLFGLIAAHVLHNLTFVLTTYDDWWWIVSVSVVALAALWSILHRQDLADDKKTKVIDDKGDPSHAVIHGHR